MESVARRLSPVVLVLALICFFLPFVTFSCEGQKVATFSGIQMATGITIKQPQVFGPPKSRKVNAEPLALFALLAILAGAGLGFLKGRKGAVSSGALAALGIILIAALRSKLESEALQQSAGAIQVNYGAGYYLILFFLIVAVGTSVYVLVAGKGNRLSANQRGGGGKFCTQCGARNADSNLFCRECGWRLG